MYKLLLCWRYLRTRFLAFICIGSVMLGVATLIVVNSVMSGFSTKLKDRLHGLLSDVVIETPNYNGFVLPAEQMQRMIEQSPIASHIQAMTPTIEVFAMINFQFRGQNDTRAINLIGIDPKGRAAIGGFSEFLMDPQRQKNPSFEFTSEALFRFEALNPLPLPEAPSGPIDLNDNQPPPPEPTPESQRTPRPAILGWAICSYRDTNPKTGQMEDVRVLYPGDSATIVTVGAGKERPEPVFSNFVVADYFRSEMAEYDSHLVFVPLDYLQQLRAMNGKATHFLIRLKDYSQSRLVVQELQKMFPERHGFYVRTWEEKQGALIAAIDVERGLLNLLLFLIVGVAGFSILAIFSMIVVEKTRDIGILKSLGAGNRGILTIFITYGFLLGFVGCVLGTILGLVITEHINDLEKWITQLTGREVFDRKIYYFSEIPTDIQALTVFLVNAGAIGIAVLFSVLPAIRAAMLHPVRALRYE